MRAALMLMFALACGPSAPATATYEGSWTGLCQRLSDCECSVWTSAPSCATTLESSYAQGMSTARRLGMSEAQLASRRLGAAELSEISNSSCEAICTDMAAMLSTMQAGRP